MERFVPCNDPDSTCSNLLGSFGGVAGVCDNVTLLCVCPPGYSGVDLLSRWNDCHVNAAVRISVESIAMVVNLAALAMTLFGIYRLLRSWEAKLRIERGWPRISYPKLTANESSLQRQAIEKRKRMILMFIFANLLSFSILNLTFEIMVLADADYSVLQRPNGLGLFIISTEIGAMVVALYMVLFAWFDSLPSFRLFSRTFPQIKSYFLVRYPGFIFFTVLINCFFTCTLSFGVFFIFSYVRPDRIPTLVIPWGMTVFGFELGVFVVNLTLVCVLLLRLINVFSRSSSSGNKSPRGNHDPSMSPEVESRFKEAKQTVWAMMLAGWFAGPFAVGLCLIMAWLPFASANFFFFVALLQAAAACVSLFITYVFVFRMHYGTRKVEETSALVSPTGMERGGGSGDGSISLGGDIHSPNPKFSFFSNNDKTSTVT